MAWCVQWRFQDNKAFKLQPECYDNKEQQLKGTEQKHLESSQPGQGKNEDKFVQARTEIEKALATGFFVLFFS